MNVAILTAGGIGSRTHQDIPKQFLNVDNKPIIIPLVQTRFLVSRPTLDPARRLGISDTRLSLSPAGLPSPFSYLTSATTQSEPRDARITVWALSISLAATLEIDKFSFSSSGYLDVSVPRVPHVQLCIHCTLTEVSSAGFPHSDISGSLDMCSSPKLFAAYHVFHRLLVPRHPPCALTTLTVAGTIESLDSLFPH